jgi:DNA mismatch repair protein MutL
VGKINILNQELINLIAAGEVVERPSSVVKELVENSIDSGANQIIINIENSGKDLIEVIDNGSGIDFEDAEKVLTQHATSKISSKDNLENINTMGFRGEALASIAEVSAETIVLSRSISHEGLNITKSNNDIRISVSKKSDIGTQIRISGLFKNIPARLKFLKKDSTELKHLIDTFINTALPFNDIYFELNHNGKNILKLTKRVNLIDRIYEISNKELSSNLIYNLAESNNINIEGFVGNTSSGQKGNKYQYIFINNRFIKSGLIFTAIKQAYRGFLHRDLNPCYFLFLTLDPKSFDINVHPRKLEVKFEDERIIFSTVYNFVKKLLENESKSTIHESLNNHFTKDIAEDDEPRENPDFIKSAFKSDFRLPNAKSSTKPRNVKSALNFTKTLFDDRTDLRNNSVVNDLQKPEIDLQKGFIREYQQIFNPYILFEEGGVLNFIDQHAAAEKIAFEKILKNIGKVQTKPLLIPQIFEFKNSAEKEEILESKVELDSIGFIIDDFGGSTIQISEIPELLEIKDFPETMSEFLKSPEQVGIEIDMDKLAKFRISESLYLKVATIACHGSIRAGQKLEKMEMERIVNDLMELDNPGNCPHGRPVLWKLPKTQIEKNFNRDI